MKRVYFPKNASEDVDPPPQCFRREGHANDNAILIHLIKQIVEKIYFFVKVTLSRDILFLITSHLRILFNISPEIQTATTSTNMLRGRGMQTTKPSRLLYQFECAEFFSNEWPHVRNTYESA
mmetsp:Transcript_39429/g.76994  ORF Transcript_39429/g.76994 Transcript_39429/m.76994 type:complete len:122 (+) Transcript_39429:116-481(+)